ncbi:MAG: PAS domain S-box protein, partial [Prolixibacteraceae bacterium]|nr:PAS domain S-box protein [Prolixibacteraceae bacterium]
MGSEGNQKKQDENLYEIKSVLKGILQGKEIIVPEFIDEELKELLEDLQNKRNLAKDLKKDIAGENIENEIKFIKIVMNESPFAMWISDAEGTVLFTNSTLQEILKLTNREIAEKYNVLQDNNLTEQGVMPQVQSVYSNLKPANFIIYWEGKKVNHENFTEAPNLWIEVSMYPITDKNGNLLNVICQWVDITELKQRETELREKSNFLDKIIEGSALSIWISDENGTAIKTNQACLDFFGAEKDEVIGKYNLFKDSVLSEQGFLPEIKKVFKNGETVNLIIDYDFSLVGHVDVKNATHKIINSIFTPVINQEGKVTNAIVQSIDLTGIKNTEKQLRESEEKMRFLVNTSSELANISSEPEIYNYIADKIYGIIGEQGVVVLSDFLNENYDWSFRAVRGINNKLKAISKLLGKDITKLSGKGKSVVTERYVKVELLDLGLDISEISSGIIPEKLVSVIFKILPIKKIYGIPLMKDDKNLGVVSIITTSDKQGINKELIEAFVLQASAFLNRKKAEQDLRKSEEKFRLAMEATRDGLWDWDIKTNKVYFSPGWAKILEEDSVDNIFSTWEERLHPEDKESVFHSLQNHLNGKTSHWQNEHRLLTRNGYYKFVLGRGKVVKSDENNKPSRMIGTMVDISEQKLHEQDIQNQNEFIQTILDNLPIGLATNKINEGTTSYVNTKFEEIYGWPRSEINDVGQFFEKVFPDKTYRESSMKQIIADINSGDPEKMHWENLSITGKNGQTKYVNAVNIPLFKQNIMVSTVMDITDLKLVQQELQNHRDQLEELVKIRTKELENKNIELKEK